MSGNSGFFGTQNGVFKLRRVSVTGLLNYSRDSFSASISNERRTTVTNAVANDGLTLVPAGTTTTGTFGSLTWGHQLSDRLSSTVTGSYGVNDNSAGFGFGAGSQTSFTGAASLNYVFSPTLTGRVIYTHTNVSSSGTVLGPNSFNNGFNFNSFGTRSGSYDENALLAGVRKSF